MRVPRPAVQGALALALTAAAAWAGLSAHRRDLASGRAPTMLAERGVVRRAVSGAAAIGVGRGRREHRRAANPATRAPVTPVRAATADATAPSPTPPPTPEPVAVKAPPSGKGGTALPAHAPSPAPTVLTGSAAVLSTAVPPRSIQVVEVPVPAPFPPTEAVRYHVEAEGRATVISAHQGTVAAVDTGVRQIAVVTQVPARAPAGPLQTATVRFDGERASVVIPVILRIDRVRRPILELGRPVYASRGGERITLDATIANGGNTVDTFALATQLPVGWSLARPTAPVVLRPGERRDVQLAVDIPRDPGTTHAYIPLTIGGEAGASPLATTDAIVELLDASGKAHGGPRMTAGVASVLGDQNGQTPVLGFDVAGPYDDHTTIIGRGAFALDPRDANIPGLSRVGYYLNSAYLSAISTNWQGTIGTTGHSFSDLTGINAFGRGVSGAWNDGAWQAAGLAAGAPSGDFSNGHVLGGQVGYRTAYGVVSATGTSLQENVGTQRSLDAFGVGMQSNTIAGTVFSGELADRQTGNGSGLGWEVRADRHTSQDYALFQASHAPGGSAGFANATDQVQFVGFRQLDSTFGVLASAYRGTDHNPTFPLVRSTGWAIGPTVNVGARTSASADVHQTSNDDDGFITGFRTSATGATARVTTQVSGYATSLEATADRVDHANSVGPASLTSSAWHQGARARLAWSNATGFFDATAAYDHAGPGIGLPPNAVTLMAQAQHLRVFHAQGAPRFDVSAAFYSWLGDQPSALIIRAGTSIPIGAEYLLTVDAEHNPLLNIGRPATPWVVAVKFERTLGLPFGGRRAQMKGVVFEDRNGNGVHDPDEPLLPGVIVRRGGERAVTDADGHYQFYDASAGAPSIDATSLPLDLSPIATMLDPKRDHARMALAVVPTSPVSVTVVEVPDELDRRPTTPLIKLSIEARDSAGSVWAAPADSLGRARFDALPPGRYTIDVDFSGTVERLRVVGPNPVVSVQAGTTLPPIEIQVGLPKIKISVQSGGRDNGGRR